MPVRRTNWISKRTGRRRWIRLFMAWRRLNQRVRGTALSSNGKSYWQGLPVDFESWDHFRQWSLDNGYCRERCSLDRIDSALGYSPENCRWVTVAENSRRAGLTTVARYRRGRDPSGRVSAAPSPRLIESRAAANRNASALESA